MELHMTFSLKSSANIAVLFATLCVITPASYAASGVIGGAVAPFNEMTDNLFFNNIMIDPTTTMTDVVVASGLINNNNDKGWELQVASANAGILKRGLGGTSRQINYQNIKLVKVGGILGTNLTDPNGSVKSLSSGGAVFGTGAALGISGTLNYSYELQVDLPADPSLLSGQYTDTLTLTLVAPL
jgi:hypothetical protein